MTDYAARLGQLWPEMVLGVGALLCLLMGLARRRAPAAGTPCVAGLALIVAGVLVVQAGAAGGMAGFVKLTVCGVGVLLVLLSPAPAEAMGHDKGGRSDGRGTDGEFYFFFLLSLAGVMLTAGACDLVWLLLALELTSLPTYAMVALSRRGAAAQEAAVKYFFLGAMATGVFLLGFALVYGATGFTDFAGIAATAGTRVNRELLVAGLVLAIAGIGYKVAAFPMHFYVADVYQGAASAVSAFLAFAPKTAGLVAILLLLELVRPVPREVYWLLWAVAAATMTVGNVLGLLQRSVKRILAYSSMAHSGYMLVGLTGAVASREGATTGGELASGYGAVLFYLVVYALANLAGFGVLGSVRTAEGEADGLDDLGGLARRRPGVAAVMLASLLSLIGLPPLAGFVGKLYLFGSAVGRGRPELVALVVIGVINSAISAVYYLRVAGACFFGEEEAAEAGGRGGGEARRTRGGARPMAAAIAAVMVLVLGLWGNWLVKASDEAAAEGGQGVRAGAEGVER